MKTAKERLIAGIRAEWPVLLIGQPGIGKTDLCRQVADELGMGFVLEVATTAEPSDVKGLPCVVNGRAEFQPYGTTRALIEAVRPTLCLIDDLGHAAGEVQKAFMHLVLARTAGSHAISPHVRFVAATNDVGQKAGVSGIISPLQNRVHHVRCEPHVGTWLDWATSNRVTPEVVGFVRSAPKLFESWRPPVGIEPTCTPRSLKMLSDFMLAGARNVADYVGCVGHEVASQFSAFLRVYGEMASLEEIIKNPKKARLPEGIDRSYALCALLGCQESGWSRLIPYVERLPVEFQVLVVSDCTARYPELKKDPSIVGWVRDHKGSLL